MQSDVSTVDLSAETKVDIDLVQDIWTRVDTTFPDGLVTIRNIGGTSVSAYLNDDSSFIVNDENLNELGIDPLEIGGLVYELSNIDNEEVWVKANESTGRVSVRILGTVSPDEDIVKQATLLNSTIIQLETHIRNKQNPHETTKTQVGLGNIPNAISDSVTDDNSEQLATSKAVKVVQDNLNSHSKDKENPHETTKEHVGLGNVDNYKTATLVNCTDETLDNIFMTPRTTFEAVSKWTGMATNVAAQSVVKGAISNRLEGWGSYDCSPTIATVVKPVNSDKFYTVKAGLQVGYADKGKVRISIETTKDFECVVADDYYDTGVLYVFVNINSEGEITDVVHTEMPPSEGMYRLSGAGDFFNAAECVMYDSVNNPVNRVYISKLIMTEGRITDIINVPIGYEHIVPVDNKEYDLKLGLRAMVDNPFIGDVYTEAEVEYDNVWGPSYWNDQVGVKASPNPFDTFNQCIVQCGNMGFLAFGRESGSPFQATGNSITSPDDIRIRVRFTKKYR